MTIVLQAGVDTYIYASTCIYAYLERMYRDLSQRIDQLKIITPGSEAYGNETDAHEFDWERAFGGENREELVRVKGR